MSDELNIDQPVEVVENKTSHPREQWYRIYAYEPGIFGPVQNSTTGEIESGWIKEPSWGPIDDRLHVHHPDVYHPDLRVRIAHHRGVLKSGEKPAACGAVHDPRMVFVEAHDETDRCPECVAATAAVNGAHEAARAILIKEGIAGLDAQIAAAEAALAAQGLQIPPEPVAPEVVDEVLTETPPETLGSLE